MNAQDLAKISTSITDREKLERVFNEVLVPAMKLKAKRKLRELEIRGNRIPRISEREIIEQLNTIGIKGSLQTLVEEAMKPLLREKGFTVATYSPSYLVAIRW